MNVRKDILKKYIGYIAVLVVLLTQGGNFTDLAGKAALDLATRMGTVS